MVMNMRRCVILVWMMAGLQVLSAGQNPPAQSTGNDSAGDRTAPAAPLSAIAGMQPEGGVEDSGSDTPQIPSLLGGKGISSAFLSELGRSNYLRGGVSVGAAYDDNPLLLSSGGGNTGVSIFPNLSIEQSTSRTRWTLGYAGGVTINDNKMLKSQNHGSHNFNFDSQYRLSSHVNLRVAEKFSMVTGFFDGGNGVGVIGSGGPNASLLTPLATQRSSLTTVGTSYHFALNDLIGASGSFYDLHFTNVPTGAQQLTDSQTASGSAFWLHRIFRGDWGGVSYGFQRITFNPNGETRAHNFLVVNTLSLSKRVTLTGFIGPQYVENRFAPGGTPFQSSDLSIAGGAEGGWADQRTSVSTGYSRSISDGGGVLGSVRLQAVHANFRRELVPGWAAAVTASHGTSESLTPFQGSSSSARFTSAGISVERNVGKSIGLRMGYTHDFQQQIGLTGLAADAHRNRFFATLSYQWAKPLGM